MIVRWKIIARHKWVSGAVITESYNIANDSITRFTATIKGWRHWGIYQGPLTSETVKEVKAKVAEIRDLIEKDDTKVFDEKQYPLGFFPA